MKKTILMIDDDFLPMQYYEEALALHGFAVRRFSVDEAVHYVEVERGPVDFVVVDVMMPPGETFRDEDTDHGLKTGALLLARLRTSLASVPVIVLTNVLDEARLEAVRKVDPRVRVFHKTDCAPLDLVDKIEGLLNQV